MKVRKKPKPPVPGNEPGKFSRYEIRQTVSHTLTAAGAVGISILTALATQPNSDTLWQQESFAGLVGVMVVAVIKMWLLRRNNNSNKRA